MLLPISLKAMDNAFHFELVARVFRDSVGGSEKVEHASISSSGRPDGVGQSLRPAVLCA